jgi:hypothetical protein
LLHSVILATTDTAQSDWSLGHRLEIEILGSVPRNSTETSIFSKVTTLALGPKPTYHAVGTVGAFAGRKAVVALNWPFTFIRSLSLEWAEWNLHYTIGLDEQIGTTWPAEIFLLCSVFMYDRHNEVL